MENYKEIAILIFKIIATLTIWYYIFKLLFKGIRAIFRYFFPKKPISIQVPLSEEEKARVIQDLSSATKASSNSVLERVIKAPFIFVGKILKAICHALTTHCPKCDSEEIEELGSEEIDRYLTSKRVTERLASGKTKTRYVNCTKVTIRDHYHCKDCGHKFNKTRTKELS